MVEHFNKKLYEWIFHLVLILFHFVYVRLIGICFVDVMMNILHVKK